eukprot:CAMPEP_0194082644 /NCGR_PEP_ID=MMETSP0149-20130528/8098_1 /TAXON_ID=122233 /ORGANISM="Chaetoceros debilis, Strain MM31A-1" /LENGTH=231 /DNA_ID=CAMNT_0038764841 /DNA_START=185 /DNA_END=881 /DNA_ORIENTATION=+
MGLCQCMKEADVVLLTNKNIASNAPLPTAPPIEPFFRSDRILATNQQEQKYLQQVTEIDTDSQNDVPSVDDKTSESAHGSDDWENLAIILPFDDNIKPAISTNSPMGIWNACEEGNMDKVTELLSDDHLLLMQLCPDTHKTPLYFASLGGNIDVMLFLLDKGAADDDGSCYLATSRAEAGGYYYHVKRVAETFLTKRYKKFLNKKLVVGIDMVMDFLLGTLFAADDNPPTI